MLELNKIHQGDCLELMKEIPDNSVDMILCDLPYGTSACKWDAIIPFDKLWEQYERIIKKTGAIVLTASQPFTSFVILSKLDLFKFSCVWIKERGTNFLNFKYQPAKAHEDIVVFSKSATSYTKDKICMNYYPIMEKGEPYKCKQGRAGDAIARDSKTRENSNNIITENSGERFPKSTLFFNTETGLHPTQKPVALFEYLIKTYSNEGDLILDNCAGSGTTGVACINTKRNYILIEKDKNYFEIAKKRLDEVKVSIPPKDKSLGILDTFL